MGRRTGFYDDFSMKLFVPSSQRTYSLQSRSSQFLSCVTTAVHPPPTLIERTRRRLGRSTRKEKKGETHFCSFHSAKSGINNANAELTPLSSRYCSNSAWTDSSRFSNCPRNRQKISFRLRRRGEGRETHGRAHVETLTLPVVFGGHAERDVLLGVESDVVDDEETVCEV